MRAKIRRINIGFHAITREAFPHALLSGFYRDAPVIFILKVIHAMHTGAYHFYTIFIDGSFI